MSHTGGGELGYYPGTRASYQMLKNDETSWGMKPLVALDMPFTAVMDTVLILGCLPHRQIHKIPG